MNDALERILYAHDKLVSNGPNGPPVADGNGRRVEVTVELLERLLTPEACRHATTTKKLGRTKGAA